MMFTNGLLSAGSRGADPARGKELVRLHIANADLQSARALVNQQVVATPCTWWYVQDLWLSHLEDGQDPDAMDNALRLQLETLAATDDIGAGVARAGWLRRVYPTRQM